MIPMLFHARSQRKRRRLSAAGVYYEAYKKLGAHPVEIKGVKGTHFRCLGSERSECKYRR